MIIKNPIIKNKISILMNTESETVQKKRALLLKLFEIGIQEADPYSAVKSILSLENDKLNFRSNDSIDLKKIERIIVIGAGKATGNMATAIEDILEEKIEKGIICMPKNENNKSLSLKKIEICFGGHPYVNEGSITGAKKILRVLEGVKEKDLVICLISGGGSALMELPLSGIKINELKTLFDLLTQKGATIHELNIVRKHFSQIKGGKLALKAQPARVITLIISDVVGNNLDTIASGPTTADNSTWIDVENIFKKYSLFNDIPAKFVKMIEKGKKGKIEETIKENNLNFKNIKNCIIASNEISCKKMKEYAIRKGYDCKIISTTITGEARDVGKEMIEKLEKEEINTILIAGGETTVRVEGEGIGGRNQELVLGAGLAIKEKEGLLIGSIGTDGIDGPTDAAGAFFDSELYLKAQELKLLINQFLEKNDSYNYFNQVKGLLKTGATGTNVMDLIVAIK